MNKQEEKRNIEEERTEKRELLFFITFIFLMTAEKNKSTDLSSFSFLMVGEAYEMRGSEMKKDEELNKWKQAERRG